MVEARFKKTKTLYNHRTSVGYCCNADTLLCDSSHSSSISGFDYYIYLVGQSGGGLGGRVLDDKEHGEEYELVPLLERRRRVIAGG